MKISQAPVSETSRCISRDVQTGFVRRPGDTAFEYQVPPLTRVNSRNRDRSSDCESESIPRITAAFRGEAPDRLRTGARAIPYDVKMTRTTTATSCAAN